MILRNFVIFSNVVCKCLYRYNFLRVDEATVKIQYYKILLREYFYVGSMKRVPGLDLYRRIAQARVIYFYFFFVRLYYRFSNKNQFDGKFKRNTDS